MGTMLDRTIEIGPLLKWGEKTKKKDIRMIKNCFAFYRLKR